MPAFTASATICCARRRCSVRSCSSCERRPWICAAFDSRRRARRRPSSSWRLISSSAHSHNTLSVMSGMSFSARKALVGFHLQPRLGELRLEAGRGGFLVEQLARELRREHQQVGLGGDHLRLRFLRLLHQLGVGHLQDDAVGGDVGAGPQHDLHDLAGVLGGDPLLALGHQRALAAHLAQHLAAFDGVDPEGAALDRGSGGLEPGERQAAGAEDDDCHRSPKDAAAAELLCAFGAGDVHGVPQLPE